MRKPLPALSIIDWLLTEARELPGIAPLLSGFVERVQSLGLPLWRVNLSLPLLHPQLFGMGYVWREDWTEVSERKVPRQMVLSSTYHHSPIGMMHRTRQPVRRRLAGPDAEIDFPVLEELAQDGATDYYLMPMPMTRGRIGGLGLATRDAKGFDDGQVALVGRLLPALSAVLEIHLGRITTGALLDTYVGHEAGRRILAGQIVPGTGRTIDAVIFIADLRNFTGLSETMERDELLAMMNDYFGTMVSAVHKAGGEVLKFIGDGILAIFRTEDTDREEACARSLIAALEAENALDRLNVSRLERGLKEIRAGIALHVGPVIFGNIGAPDRLDFTVIGPAVNRASRIETLNKTLGTRIICSRRFAEASPVRLQSLGKQVLRGVPKPQEVFTPFHSAQDVREEQIEIIDAA